jgi:hypothetical protein
VEPVPHVDVSMLSNQLGLAAMIPLLIQWLKTSPRFAWIDDTTVGLARALQLVTATMATAGIAFAYAWDGSTLTLTFGNVTAPAVLGFLWELLKQVSFQEAVYRGLVKPGATS